MFYFNSSFYYAVLHGLFASTESAVPIIWFWASSGDEVTVLEIDKDSLYYVDEYPIVAMPYQFAGDSMTVDAYGTTIVQHISFRKDTLVMKNQWGDVSCFVPVK